MFTRLKRLLILFCKISLYAGIVNLVTYYIKLKPVILLNDATLLLVTDTITSVIDRLTKEGGMFLLSEIPDAARKSVGSC